MTQMQKALPDTGLAQPFEHERRANSEERLIPPEPLPHVSRKSLKRVKNPVSVLGSCPFCGGTPRYVDHAEIYNGRRYGDWPYALACDSCDAYVGLHPNTDIPLGTMADKKLRSARMEGKREFHVLQKEKGWGRSEAYRWLADQLGIHVSDCHWGWFGKEQCEAAEEACLRGAGETDAGNWRRGMTNQKDPLSEWQSRALEAERALEQMRIDRDGAASACERLHEEKKELVARVERLQVRCRA